MQGKEIDRLIKLIAKLPALGTRSARRIVLQLLKNKETALPELIEAMQNIVAILIRPFRVLFALICRAMLRFCALCRMLQIYGRWSE